MILNKSQAKAVADAFAALNNVNGKLEATFDNCYVQERYNNSIHVRHMQTGVIERYSSQDTFMKAYDVNFF